jgi:hypothetical protein
VARKQFLLARIFSSTGELLGPWYLEDNAKPSRQFLGLTVMSHW